MKALIIALLSFTQIALAQQVVQVSGKAYDLGTISETLGRSAKSVVLKLDTTTPESFKISFNYKYRFISQEISGAYVVNGQLGLMTRDVGSETYTGKEVLRFETDKSSLQDGELLEVHLEISKGNPNTHGVKVTATLVGKDKLTGHKRLLGLLGRSYKILKAEACPE